MPLLPPTARQLARTPAPAQNFAANEAALTDIAAPCRSLMAGIALRRATGPAPLRSRRRDRSDANASHAARSDAVEAVWRAWGLNGKRRRPGRL
jgi:hypothetical protein